VLLSCCVILCLTGTVSGQTGKENRGSGTAGDPYIVPRTESKITVDAILDEEAWQHALELELLYEVSPGENIPPQVATTVLLTYDANHLYAAFRCHDPDPSAIRAHLRDRDNIGGDDWVALIFDTFNDERRALDFLVTARGVQYDQIEAQTGEDSGWDAIWDSAGRITDWGYVVEIQLPFSSIRFQRTDGPQTWGFDAVRRYPREQAYHIGLFPRDRSNNSYLSQAVKIRGFEGASPGRNLEISPTLTAHRTDEREDFPDGDMEKQSQKVEAGVTAQWGVTPNMTLSATANPDFSQVEADARQLDINQPFALFYQERRPFFTEGADYFNALEDIIYTRTIRDPSWGFKLTGKEGGHTIGAFVMRDDITNLIFPGPEESRSTSLFMPNTSAVVRYKHDFGSRYTAGLLFTDREGADYFNRVFGFDLDFRLTPTNQVQLLVLGSSTRYPGEVADEHEQPAGTFNDRLISFEYDHETRTWGWWADYEEAGGNFRADLGYFPQVGYRNVEGGVNYTWNAPAEAWWADFRVGNDLSYTADEDGDLLNRRVSFWFSYSGIQQSFIFTRGGQTRAAYNGREFDLAYFVFSGGLWPTANLQVWAAGSIADQIDFANTRPGKARNLDVTLLAHLGEHVRFNFSHTYERMTVYEEWLYTANISQLAANYHLNLRTFFRAIVQYVDYDYNPANYTFEIDSRYRHFFTQFLFSYKINPRTMLYLGYSDNYNGNQDIPLTQSNRTFFVKLGYAWRL
jgi:hypothetical protein